MLIRATLKFLPAQLLAPLAQLASVIAWAHWLVPAEMGLLTLVTVAQEIAYMLSLGWFSIYALRYLPAADDAPGRRRYLGTENAVVLCSLGGSLLIATGVALTLPSSVPLVWRVAMVGVFFATRGLNAHYAERARAQQAFVAYTLLQSVGPIGGLALGLVVCSQAGGGAWAVLGAYAIAQALGTLVALPMIGMRLRITRPDPAMLRSAIALGLPMLGLGVLGWVAENYLRYFVQWQLGAAELGLMIVGWSLGRRCAAVASMLVATAAFPIAARLLNDGRRSEALAQLRTNAALVFGVLAPVTAGLALLAPAAVAVMVSKTYAPATAELLGLTVLGGALRNLHAHVTDQLMVLDRRFRMAADVDVIEIVACIAASAAGLALFGLRGAVVGQAVGSLLTLAVSMHWAHKHLGLHWPWADSAKVLCATAAMAIGVIALDPSRTLAGLVGGAALGTAFYAAAIGALFARRGRELLASRRT